MAPGARIGIDLCGTKTEVVLLSADGTVAWRKRVPTPRSYMDTEAGDCRLGNRS